MTDCISRKATLEPYKYLKDEDVIAVWLIRKNIEQQESIAPTKTGHWILIDEELQRYKCSECGEIIKLYKECEISRLERDETLSDYPFSHCGAKMIEPQERSE